MQNKIGRSIKAKQMVQKESITANNMDSGRIKQLMDLLGKSGTTLGQSKSNMTLGEDGPPTSSLSKILEQFQQSGDGQKKQPPLKKKLLNTMMSGMGSTSQMDQLGTDNDGAALGPISDIAKAPTYEEFKDKNLKQHEEDVEEYQKQLEQEIEQSNKSGPSLDMGM